MSFKKSTILLVIAMSFPPFAFSQDQKPFELGVEEKTYLPTQTHSEYGKPISIPDHTQKNPQLNTGVQQVEHLPPPVQAPVETLPPYQAIPPVQSPPPPMHMQQPTQGVLPPQFLGRWQVMGSRSAVEAQPQYQAGMDSIFSNQTSNIWNIQGSPQQGYMLSTDTGVSTPLMVQMQGTTAILRYQHPIRNTVAQEALVMQLGAGGAQFEGLERISIMKEGEPQPRAKVTYKLFGRRQ